MSALEDLERFCSSLQSAVEELKSRGDAALDKKELIDPSVLSAQFVAMSDAQVKLKGWNRDVHVRAAKKRVEVEEALSRVDRVNLLIANLTYKKAHLLREIGACQDLTTPELHKVEADIGTSLSLDNFVGSMDSLETKYNEAIAIIQKESRSRNALVTKVLIKSSEIQTLLEKMDRKRKHLDEAKNTFVLVTNGMSGVGSSLKKAVSGLEKEPKRAKNSKSNFHSNSIISNKDEMDIQEDSKSTDEGGIDTKDHSTVPNSASPRDSDRARDEKANTASGTGTGTSTSTSRGGGRGNASSARRR